jgi:hypothetical protein
MIIFFSETAPARNKKTSVHIFAHPFFCSNDGRIKIGRLFFQIIDFIFFQKLIVYTVAVYCPDSYRDCRSIFHLQLISSDLLYNDK